MLPQGIRAQHPAVCPVAGRQRAADASDSAAPSPQDRARPSVVLAITAMVGGMVPKAFAGPPQRPSHGECTLSNEADADAADAADGLAGETSIPRPSDR